MVLGAFDFLYVEVLCVENIVIFVDMALWPATLCAKGLFVCPTYWFLIVHFLHSSRYMTFLVLQFVCFGVLCGL